MLGFDWKYPLVLLPLAFMLCFARGVYIRGRALSNYPHKGDHFYDCMLRAKKDEVWCMIGSLVLLVVGIEVSIHLLHRKETFDFLFWVHLALAGVVLFLLGLVLFGGFNGVQNKVVHRRLVYPLLISLLLVAALGFRQLVLM